MSNIERWERLAVLSWDRHGMPQTVRALTPGGMALRDGETEYVRADLHRGAVSLTDDEWDRVVWWLSRPVPPSPMKALDEAILHKIAAARGGQ